MHVLAALPKIDERVSDRISITRFIAIVAIVGIHIPLPGDYPAGAPDLFWSVRSFLTSVVFRAAVPILTCISGYLLFAMRLDANAQLLMQKKFRSLGVPLVLWNGLLLVVFYAIQSTEVITFVINVNVYPFDIGTWLKGLLGTTGYPLNPPLFFLRDLFVISVLSTCLGPVLRRYPWPGFIVVSVVFWFNLDGYMVLKDTMVINFCLGALAAIKSWNLTYLDRYKWRVLCMFLIVAFAVQAYRHALLDWFRIVSPILVWPLIHQLQQHRFGRALRAPARYSFAIFLCHYPVLAVLHAIYMNAVPTAPYMLFWCIAPAAAIAAGFVIRGTAIRVSPRVANVLFGGR